MAGKPMDQDRFVREGPLRSFLEPRLLFLIRRQPSYGYQLTEEIASIPVPVSAPDSAAVYRMLRELERNGLVASRWESGDTGPAKRVYNITPQGESRLDTWVKALKERVRVVNDFIAMCEKEGRGG